jgi:SH3-like domain-containing protein
MLGLCKAMLTGLSRRLPIWAMALLAMAALWTTPALAQQTDNPSGLPLPRFATTRSDPINVRVGPGTRYEVAWIYLKPGVPVEIIQEFDTWRKIRDVDGVEGWVHQNLLSGARAAYVAPWDATAQVPLRSSRSPEAAPRALLTSRFRVSIDECDGQWCAVSATHQPEGERPATYSGYVSQAELWGVYQTETFD